MTVRLRSAPGRTFSGKVGVIYPQVNPDTRATRVRIELPNPDGALLPDMYAEVEIAAPGDADATALGTVHAPDYLDFLRGALTEWEAMPGHGEEVVPNMHPSPEMLAQGARRSTTIIGKTGWYTADAACPIGPGTWEASVLAAAGALAALAPTYDFVRARFGDAVPAKWARPTAPVGAAV